MTKPDPKREAAIVTLVRNGSARHLAGMLREAAKKIEEDPVEQVCAMLATVAGELARRQGCAQTAEDLRDLADLLERGAFVRGDA